MLVKYLEDETGTEELDRFDEIGYCELLTEDELDCIAESVWGSGDR